MLLFAPLALVSCQPSGDARQASEAVARSGGEPTADVSVLPPDESVATPSNQLSAGDQSAASTADAASANAEEPPASGR